MDSSFKRLLAISWCMPPLLFPRSIQVGRTLKYLTRGGWETTVITVEPRSGSYASTVDTSLQSFYGDFYQSIQVPTLEGILPVRALAKVIPLLGSLPDMQRLWVGRALHAAEQLVAREKFSTLATFAYPWSDHLVGLQLHQHFGLPWLVHFSDPWVDNPYFRYYSRWHRNLLLEMERAVIREADAVIFTNIQTADMVMQKYPLAWRKKVTIIPHSFDPDLLPSISHVDKDSQLRIIYAGNFYLNRNPFSLLDALRNVNRQFDLRGVLRLDIIGHVDWKIRLKAQTYLAGIEHLVHFRGLLSYEESLHALAQADVLLVVDAASEKPSLFLPSKLIDYLMFKKPIWGITPPQGASADLLRRLGCKFVDPTDVNTIAKQLEEIIAAWHNNSLLVSPDFDDLASEFDANQTTREFADILTGITK